MICFSEKLYANNPTSQDLRNISPCERVFTEQGFHEGYTRAYDEIINEGLPLADSLRRENTDAKKTHIEAFAKKIPDHIKFIIKHFELPEKFRELLYRFSITEDRKLLERLFRMKSYQDLKDEAFKFYVQLRWLEELTDEEGIEDDEYGFENDEELLSFIEIEIEREDEDKDIKYIASVASKLSLQTRHALVPEEKDYLLLIKYFYFRNVDFLDNLAFLEESAAKAIQNKTVTYDWWLRFNRYIVKLMHSAEYTSLSDEELQHPVENFPQEIIIPSLHGEIGIMTINRAIPKGVYIYSMGTNEEFQTLEAFTEHDEGHIIQIRGANLRADPAYNLFHNKWVEAVEDLPINKQKNIEIIYHLLIFEEPQQFVHKSPKELKRFLVEMIVGDIAFLDGIKRLKTFSESLPEQARQIEKMADDFIELFIQIQNIKSYNIQPYSEQEFAKIYNQVSEANALIYERISVSFYSPEDFIK